MMVGAPPFCLEYCTDEARSCIEDYKEHYSRRCESAGPKVEGGSDHLVVESAGG